MKGIKYWDTKKNKHVLAYHIEENGYAYNKKKTLLIGVVGLDLVISDGFGVQIKKLERDLKASKSVNKQLSEHIEHLNKNKYKEMPEGFVVQLKKDAGSIDADELYEAAFKYAKDLYRFAKDEDIKESTQFQAFKDGVKWHKKHLAEKLKDRIDTMADTHDEIQDNG